MKLYGLFLLTLIGGTGSVWADIPLPNALDITTLCQGDWKAAATAYRVAFQNTVSIRAALVRFLLAYAEQPRSYEGIMLTVGKNCDGTPLQFGPIGKVDGPLHGALPREVLYYGFSLLHPDSKLHWIMDVDLCNRRHQIYLAAGLIAGCATVVLTGYIVLKTGSWAITRCKRWLKPPIEAAHEAQCLCSCCCCVNSYGKS